MIRVDKFNTFVRISFVSGEPNAGSVEALDTYHSDDWQFALVRAWEYADMKGVELRVDWSFVAEYTLRQRCFTNAVCPALP